MPLVKLLGIYQLLSIVKIFISYSFLGWPIPFYDVYTQNLDAK